MSERVRYIAGCMTGTSLDGLDVVLTEVRGTGLEMTAHFHGLVSLPLGDLAGALRHFAEDNTARPLDYLRAARKLGELHADGVLKLCDEHLPNDRLLDFVVAHGQTIWHAPRDDVGHLSWQLFDPWPIVRRMHTPVCYDLRQADLIAGGEGAPLTPIADWVLFRYIAERPTIFNLGGVLNMTYLDQDIRRVRGRDEGPCNLLLDGIVRHFYPDRNYDAFGKIAQQGRPHTLLPERIGAAVDERRPERGRSMGREDYGQQWIAELVRDLDTGLSPEDWVRNILDCVAKRIGKILIDLTKIGPAIFAGGGVKNRFFVDQIRRFCDVKSPTKSTVYLTEELGIPCEAREAMGFAVLGALSQDGVPISLSQVTGAKEPGVAGVWAGV